LSVTVSSTGSSTAYATADNLYFAVVPAPGAVALIAVAGLVGSRRRR
jgi:MYXO-CTERM domain-containing protein